MIKNWEDKGAFLIPAFVFAVLVLLAFGPALTTETLERWIKILSALLTPLIAIIAVYIAYQQSHTAKMKLKSDLFDRRLVIYNSLMDLITSALGGMKVSNEELYRFSQNMNNGYYLFGREIFLYLDEVRRKVILLGTHTDQLNSPQTRDKERTKIIQERLEVFSWISDQYELSRKKFEDHLSLP
jgi:hypothetical protein